MRDPWSAWTTARAGFASTGLRPARNPRPIRTPQEFFLMNSKSSSIRVKAKPVTVSAHP